MVSLLSWKPWGDLVKRSVTVTLDPVGKGVGELSAVATTTSKPILTS